MASEVARPAIERLPHELRKYISKFVDRADAFYLARVSSGWQDPAEAIIWRSLTISDTPSPWEPPDETDSAHRYADISAAFQTRSERATYVKELLIRPVHSLLNECKEIIRLVSPHLERLAILGEDYDWSDERLQVWTTDRVCAALPLLRPALRLKQMRISTGMEWEQAIKGCLRFAPNLEEIGLHNGGWWDFRSRLDWPTANTLQTIRIEKLRICTLDFLAFLLDKLAPNVACIDIGIWELEEDEYSSEAMKVVLRHQRLRAFKTDGIAWGRWPLAAILSGVEAPFAGVEALYLPLHVSHCSSFRDRAEDKDDTRYDPADSFFDLLGEAPISLPRLRYVFIRDTPEVVERLHTDLSDALESGNIPPWIRLFDQCPQLRRIIIVSGEFYGAPIEPISNPDMCNLPVSYLDYFQANSGSSELRHIALRVEKELLANDFALRTENGNCPEYIAYNPESDRHWKLEQVTMDLAVAGGRVMSTQILQEIYELGQESGKVAGIGDRHLELSGPAWSFIGEWLKIK